MDFDYNHFNDSFLRLINLSELATGFWGGIFLAKERKNTRETENEHRPKAAVHTKRRNASQANHDLCPIVAIGASAGGLKAFKEFFKHLPTDTGMAFVAIQHLLPTAESMLAELLGRSTKLPVIEATSGMKVEPNAVYVVPRDADMTIVYGVLRLSPRAKTHGLHMPIDIFFRSLAEDRGTRAVGVVLSGTGSDGMIGLEEIKAKGGITFAQDPATAEYGAMPVHAIASGIVDFVLSPDAIADELIKISRHPYVAQPEELDSALSAVDATLLDNIFALLRAESGIDFSDYKQATIKRRIARRMAIHKMAKLEDYAAYLQQDPIEVAALFKDFLITVTEFFRDPATFEALKTEIFPEILRHKENDEPVRIWVPGCSTGEEVYSIAIALIEFLDNQRLRPPVQIFGTDIKEETINKARAGIYPEGIVEHVSPERLERFFVKAGDGYRINTAVRELCVFAVHDVTSNPPFSKLDLISCRNLLIYLNQSLQRNVIATFHYALQPWGYLVLGASESVGRQTELFELIDKKRKVYARKPAPSRAPHDYPSRAYVPQEVPYRKNEALKAERGAASDARLQACHALISKYSLAGVFVNEHGHVMQFYGNVDPFARFAPGEPSNNLFDIAREDIALELQTAVYEARTSNATVTKEGLTLEYDGARRIVTIDVIPIKGSAGGFYFLVLFEDMTAKGEAETAEPLPPKERDVKDKEIARLKQELEMAKEYLQSVVDEKDVTNEEIKAANEEIQSSNEELQTINEELETAKEELQSSNEELSTLNEELQNRNLELMQLSDDLNNLLISVDIPIVMLGSDLKIRRVTPKAQEVLSIGKDDIGKPVSSIESCINVPGLERLAQDAIGRLNIKEQEIQDRQERWHLMQIRPYKTGENRIEGAVVALFGIDDLKRSLIEREMLLTQVEALAAQIEKERDFYQRILDSVPVPISYLDEDLIYRLVNKAAAKALGYAAEKIVGRPLIEIVKENPWIYEAVKGVKETGKPFEKMLSFTPPGLEVEHHFTVAYLPDKDEKGNVRGVFTGSFDVTELVSTQKKIEEDKRLSDALNDINSAISSTLDFGEIMQRVVVGGAKAIAAETAAISLRRGDRWVVGYAYGFSTEITGATMNDNEEPHAVLAIKTKRPVVIEDAYNDERVNREHIKKYGIRSVMVIPLIIKDEVIGVLFFNYHSAPVTFAKARVDFATKLGSSISLALENARLYEAERQAHQEEEEHSRRLEVLHQITNVIVTSLDTKEVAENISTNIAAVFGIDSVTLWIEDENRKELMPIADTGLLEPFFETPIEIGGPYGSSEAFLSGSPVFVEDIGASSGYSGTQERFKKAGLELGAFAALPIKEKGRAIGALSLFWQSPKKFTQDDIGFFAAISNEVAIGLENARLHEKSVARARTFEAVVQMGRLITSTLSMSETLRQILDYSMLLLNTSASLMLILDEKREVFKVAAGEGIPDSLEREELTLAEATSLGFENPTSAFIDDLNMLSKTPFFLASAREGFVSAVISPMFMEGNPYGLLMGQEKKHLLSSEEDLAAFRLFTNQAASAIRNAERYEAERNIADILQETLLTMPEKIEGIDLGYLYHSATEAARVGGDFYDLFELKHGKIGILIGDVSGKGIEATALTTVVKNTIKAHSYEDGTPARVMSKTNDLLVRVSAPGNFVTVFFGILETATGKLSYCSAGHSPAMIKRGSGGVELLEKHSPVIGAFSGMHYRSSRVALAKGDILVLYTDGVIEARCDGELYGEERLVKLVGSLEPIAAREMPQAIFSDVKACSHDKLSDDIAILSLSLKDGSSA